MKALIIKIIFFVIQWSWGIIQNLVGLLVMLIIPKMSVEPFHGAVAVEYESHKFTKNLGGFALGMFIFYPQMNPESKQNLLTHEYGHTIQSLIYGPLYLPVVGLCSVRWSQIYWKNREIYNKQNIFYADKYPEKQANFWGEKLLGHPGIKN